MADAWFAYIDEEDGVARAACFSLGLFVKSPTVREATDNIIRLAEDYFKGPNPYHRRFVGDEVWNRRMLEFARQCSSHPNGRTEFWDCGIIQQP